MTKRAYRARIDVRLDANVNDPQGNAVRDGLLSLGHDDVRGVRIGKIVELTLEAADAEEARGRVERLFGTLQGRLPQELRLAAITTIEEANRYIAETFLPAFNAQFTVPAAEQGSAFLAYVGRALTDILAIQEERQVQNDNTLRYKRIVLQIPEQTHRRHFVKASVKVLEYPDGNLAVFHGPRCLARYDQEGALLEDQSQQKVA